MLKTIPELILQAEQKVNTVKAAEGLSLIKNTTALLIDVREPEEFNKDHLPAAINIPRGILEMQMVGKYPNANTVIITHCASGVRAVLAAEQLQRVGYSNVTAISCKFEDIYSVQ